MKTISSVIVSFIYKIIIMCMCELILQFIYSFVRLLANYLANKRCEKKTNFIAQFWIIFIEYGNGGISTLTLILHCMEKYWKVPIYKFDVGKSQQKALI